MFEKDIKEMLDLFDGKFEYVKHEYPENNYRNGFVIQLKLKRHLRLTQHQFSWGKVKAVINGDDVVVGPGFLNDITKILALVAQGMD